MDIRVKETKKGKITAIEDTLRGAVGEDPVDEEEAAANERKQIDLLPQLLRVPRLLPQGLDLS